MKKIKYILAITALSVLMVNCEDYDPAVDPPATAVGFKYANPVLLLEEDNATYELEAATTTPLDSDLTLNFEINNNYSDAEHTADAADFNTNGTIVIPAGELTGSTTVDFDFSQLNVGETKQIVFSIVDTLAIPQTINNTKMTTVIEYSPLCLFNEVSLGFTFDDYPEETSWELYRYENGSPVLVNSVEAGVYEDMTSFEQVLCLESGDYILAVYDEYGDGFCCDYGNGAFAVTLADGTVVNGDAEFGQNTTLEFTVE